MSVIWRKPVLTYAVSVGLLTASVNWVNSVKIQILLMAGCLLATVCHLPSAYLLISNVVLNRTFSKYFSTISFFDYFPHFVDFCIPGEPKKIPPTTFVDITAMHGNFCTKFYTIVKQSNIHFITKFY